MFYIVLFLKTINDDQTTGELMELFLIISVYH